MPLGTPKFYLPHTIRDKQIQKNFDELIRQVDGAYQPLDSDLTAIAALNTDPWGRALLTLAGVEAFREIGAAGQPVFGNSWVNYNAAGGTYHTAAFYKDPFARVHLRGSVKSGVLGASAFVLPAGYRPLARVGFVDYATGGAAGVSAASVEVFANGNVVLYEGSNSFKSLDGISFRAEQ